MKDLWNKLNYEGEDKTRPFPVWLKLVFGTAEFSAIILIICKLLKIIPWEWKYVLSPLWFILIVSVLLGFFWFCLGVIENSKPEKPKK